ADPGAGRFPAQSCSATALSAPSLRDALPISARHLLAHRGHHARQLDATVAVRAQRRRVHRLEDADHVPILLQRVPGDEEAEHLLDRKSTRLNSSHVKSSYAVFC